MHARRTVLVAVTLALTFAPVLALPQGGARQGMAPGERGGMAPGSGQMQQMQGMMQQIQGMMQQMAKMMQGGSVTPEQMKRMGQLLEQMSGMMGGMQDMMGSMGGRGGSPEMMGGMSQMMERTAEMQKHMAEMMGAPQRVAAEAPGGVKQAVGGGGVTVEVTWQKEVADGPSFRVVLDTHSGNLDGYRFEEIVRLRDGRGGEQAPVAVEGVEGSGHHRQATVRFAWPQPKPGELAVVVKGVAGVPERVFRWSAQ